MKAGIILEGDVGEMASQNFSLFLAQVEVNRIIYRKNIPVLSILLKITENSQNFSQDYLSWIISGKCLCHVLLTYSILK